MDANECETRMDANTLMDTNTLMNANTPMDTNALIMRTGADGW
jgi:hypothetical protein